MGCVANGFRSSDTLAVDVSENGQHCSRDDISNPKSSSCVSAVIFGFPSAIGTSKSLWPSVTSAWITLRFGAGSSGTRQNWNGAVAGSFG